MRLQDPHIAWLCSLLDEWLCSLLDEWLCSLLDGVQSAERGCDAGPRRRRGVMTIQSSNLLPLTKKGGVPRPCAGFVYSLQRT
jgi:hypothetical protein